MKKKLIQILMLLVATVSVGAFVSSCKDTNEDLYNELRTKDLENASVAEALAARIDALERLVADIKSCECDTVKMLGWVNSEDAWLQAQISALDAALDALAANTYTKDEVDDLLADLADQYAALADFMALKKDFDTYVVNNNADVRVLQDKVKELQDALKDIVSCKCDLEKLGILEGRIIEAEANAKEALDGLKDIEKIANAAQTAADKAQDAADKAQKTADDAATLAQSANTTAAEAKALADACKTLLDTAVKTATEAKTIATEAKTLAETNKSRIEKLEKDLQTLDGKINVVSETANQAVKDAAAAAAKADANKALIDKLTDRVTTNETNIATNKANIEALQESVKNLQDLAEKVGANTEAIKTLKDDVKSLNTKYDEMSTTLAALQQQVTDCQAMCKANLEAAKAELRTEIQDLESQLLKDIAVNNQAIEDLRKQHESDVEWIKEALRQISQKADGFVTQTELTDALTPILNKLTTLETTEIPNLQTELNNLSDKVLQDLKPRVETLEISMTDLTNRVTAAETAVTKLAQQVAEFKTTLQGLQDYLGRLVTGIAIQGTQNAMFGSFSIPGIEPYVLVAYYSKPSVTGSFPTSMTARYVRDSDGNVLDIERLTDTDMAMLRLSDDFEEFDFGGGLPLMNGEKTGKAYAGKVYMTINPTSADFNDLSLSIVNTKDETSVFTLENAHHSQATLQWGYTRASTNGFYEADAYVEHGELDGVERPFSATAIKDLAKDAKAQLKEIIENKLAPGQTGLEKLACDVYDVIRTLRLEKSGLKCEYTSLDGTKEAVYSQYNLAATALKPIGMAFHQSFFENYKYVPGYWRAANLINKIDKKLKEKVRTAFKELNNSELLKKIVNFNIVEVKLNNLSDEITAKFTITISDDVTVDGLTYHMVIPEGSKVNVMYAPGVKVNGTVVNVPSELLINPTEPGITKPAIIINGDITTGNSVPMQLCIPAKNGLKDEDAKWEYVFYDLAEVSGFTSELTAGGVIVIDGTNVASVSGSTLTPLNSSSIELSQVFDLSNGDAPTIHFEFTYDLKPEMLYIWGQTQTAVGNVNNMMKDLKDIIDEANNTLDKINKYETTINNQIDGIEGKLRQYLEKINGAIVNVVNGFNYQLRPYMVIEVSSQGFKVISPAKSQPTKIKADQLKIYPTSKTMEILVPFARKHVAVTNVIRVKDDASAQDGDDDCKDKLKAANDNADMNKVIDGTQRMIEVKGLVSGYKYEISYSALDFNGDISTRKGYIEIQ